MNFISSAQNWYRPGYTIGGVSAVSDNYSLGIKTAYTSAKAYLFRVRIPDPVDFFVHISKDTIIFVKI